MKRTLSIVALSALFLVALTACGGEAHITVISREDGSGTRGAFVEILGIEEKNEAGEKIDRTIDTTEITNSTSVMIGSVSGDPNAIGYISLGSLSDVVNALAIDGVAPSAATVKDGSYPVSRPFNLATGDALSPLAQDFIAFILSAEGQAVVEESGYVSTENSGPFAGSNPAGKIVVAGSSSVTPVMSALREAYLLLNPGAEIEVQQSDSTTGVNAVLDGIAEIGMASRSLKDSELEAGLMETTIAMDGIAVIVNTENPVSALSSEEVRDIYLGGVTNWPAP